MKRSGFSKQLSGFFGVVCVFSKMITIVCDPVSKRKERFRSEQIAIRPRKVYQKFDFAAGVLRSEALPVNNRVVHPDVPQKTELLQGQVPSPAADDLFW